MKMANKDRKVCLAMRWHFIIIRMDTFFKRKIAYVGKDMEKLELILIAIGNAKWAVAIEYSLADA